MRFYTLILTFTLASITAAAQIKIPTVVRQAANTLKPGAPNKSEIVLGLKEALDAGITAGVQRLSSENGFFENEKTRILFPSEAARIERTLRAAGLGKLCDDFILKMNQAAGAAVSEARPIFVNSLREMNFRDASTILFSKEMDAATRYFEKSTTAPLAQAFRPVIEKEIASLGVSKLWEDLVTRYNQIPLTAKIDTDLAGYVTQKTIKGLFAEVAAEELMIRRNSALRSTPTMKRIFKQADEQLYN